MSDENGRPIAYEMLWDCPFCGAKGLLGKTHRHCPGCGAPQDPSTRYFPEPGQEVVAENHVYVGADRLCPACGSPASAKANNCGNCGSPLEGAHEVARRTDGAPGTSGQPRAAVPVREAAKPPGRSGLSMGCLAVLAVVLLGLAGLVTSMLWTRDVHATVQGLSWNREIDVEQLQPVRDARWCDELPAGAYDVSRSREVRDHRKIPDGEDCVTRREDQGDGTFVQKKECTPRYRDEPVYDERCRFTEDRWQTVRTAKASGQADRPPGWPPVSLSPAGECRGCEREGGRREVYQVHVSVGGHETACAVDPDAWKRYRTGQTLTLSQRVVTGGISCDSLPHP